MLGECVLCHLVHTNIFYGFIIWNKRTYARTDVPRSFDKMSISLIAIPVDNGGNDKNDGLNETKCDSIWPLAVREDAYTVLV